MKPDAQRIAIAEACGWRRAKAPRYLALGDYFGWMNPRGDFCDAEELPNYLNDLNAIHGAVMQYFNPKSPGDGFRYIDELADITGCRYPNISMAFVHATAAQRAEAFLRTIGKWQEETKQ